MDKQTRIRRLKELHSMLVTHQEVLPGVKFNLNYWQSACGTAACALGSAAIHKPFVEEGLELAGGIFGKSPWYQNNSGFAAGKKFFGISGQEAYFLFAPSQYRKVDNWDARDTDVKKLNICGIDSDEEVSSLEVAHRVNMLVDHYEAQATPMLTEY